MEAKHIIDFSFRLLTIWFQKYVEKKMTNDKTKMNLYPSGRFSVCFSKIGRLGKQSGKT